MEQLVREGKVIYVGSSNFAGWHIATAQGVAAARHFMGLVSEQSLYNLNARTIELEVIPACRALRPGPHPLEPARRRAAGRRAAEGQRGPPRRATQAAAEHRAAPRHSWRPTRRCASELGEQPADVALAWLLHNPVVTAPIIGPRTAEQLTGSLRALEITLADEHVAAARRDLARPRRRGARGLRLVNTTANPQSPDRPAASDASQGTARAPDGRRIRGHGATDSELVDAGLAKWSRRGTLIDIMRDRVVFGIRNSDGDLVGFTGRAGPGDTDAPKWLNTPTTAIFTKGDLLFGLTENRDPLAAGATPVRVEGVMDALAVTLCQQRSCGRPRTVGTALTAAQADHLAHAATNQLVLHATDDDPAGLKAAGPGLLAARPPAASTSAN